VPGIHLPKEETMTKIILSFPVVTRSLLSCIWIKTNDPRQPLACVWTSHTVSGTLRHGENDEENGTEPYRLCA
jgi:hypothetical protein